MSEQWDVAVVGAGPAGAASAGLLARRGHHVILLDRAHFPRHKACAEYLSPGVLEALKRLGVGPVLDASRIRPLPGMEIVSPVGRIFRLQYRLKGDRLFAATLQRHELDDRLVNHARRQGAEVKEGFVANDVIVEDAVVRGVRGMTGGRAKEVRARLTVVADGSRSALARALGLAVPPRWPVRLGLVAHFEGEPLLTDGFGQMHVERHGYCGVAPLPDGMVNVAMVVPEDALKRSKLNATRYFDHWISDHPRLAKALEGCRRVSQVRGVSPVGSRTRRPGVLGALLVGDAADFFDPFTGEGIYRALRGAELIERVAGDVLESDRSMESSLETYDGLRRAAFRRKHAVTSLVQLFVQYPGLMEYALPRLAHRDRPSRSLSNVLGDLCEAGEFLNPGMLWSALRP